MSTKIRVLIAIVAPFVILAILVFALWLSRTTIAKVYSPEGDYVITEYCTDVGGWGYTGKIYISQTGFLFAEKHWTGLYAPCGITWLSNESFEIHKADGVHIFHVSDFFD